MTDDRLPCPSCGFLVFEDAPGSYDICPICGWEDDAAQLANPASRGGANGESLSDAQLEALTEYPLGVRDSDGFVRDPRFRPLSNGELTEYALSVKEGSPWPNKATETYYWRTSPLGFETVHTVTDFYDGPRAGIADFRGEPHYYQSAWDDLNSKWLDNFLLWPVREHVFALALEDWWIWLRWETAFHSGITTQSTHPALPAESTRHETLKAALAHERPPPPTECVLSGKSPSMPATAIQVHASFSSIPGPDGHRGWRGLAVKWVPNS